MSDQPQVIDVDEIIPGKPTHAKNAKPAQSSASSSSTGKKGTYDPSSDPDHPAPSGKKPSIDPNNPFAAFQGMMNGDASAMDDIQFDTKSLPLKQRIIFKLMKLFGTRKGLLSPWMWPIWFIVILIGGILAVCAGVIYLTYRIIRSILSSYFGFLFKK